MTTMTLRAITLAVALTLPAAVLAQDLPALSDDGLLDGIVAATEGFDAARLLVLMQEARQRGLLMFSDAVACKAEIPDTGVLSSEINRGVVSWAYHMRVWEMALAAGHCGCAFDLLSFTQFTADMTGHAPEDLTAADIGILRQFWQDRRREIEPSYAAFTAEFCARE